MAKKRISVALRPGVYLINPTAGSFLSRINKDYPESVRGVKKGEKTFTLGGEEKFVFFG